VEIEPAYDPDGSLAKSFLHDVERYKIDCEYCGGCGEQDASAAPCRTCDGRDWNNPVPQHEPRPHAPGLGRYDL
jgi:hypothetical protein